MSELSDKFRNPDYVPDRQALLDAADEIDENETLFNLRWKADMRAIKRWQEAHPGKENIWPDHADLCVWLMEQLDAK